MQMSRHAIFLGLLGSLTLLSGCIAKNVDYSEQQLRMQRCDQYVDKQRDDCLRGEAVTIEDYKDDYKAYKKSRKNEADEENEKVGKVIKPSPEIEQEDKY